MKLLTISRQTHPATFKKCRNLGQLISTVEKEGEIEGLFIVKVSLNGKVMDQEEEKLLDGLSINEVKSLEVQLSNIKEMIGNTIKDIILAIQDVQTRSIRFCREFRQYKKVDDEKVKFILIQCRSIIESLEEVFTAHVNESFMIRHHSLWVEAEKELTNILNAILQGRRISEADFLSDLIEYDLVQALDQWEEALEKELLDNPALTGIFNLNSATQTGDNGLDA